MLTKEQQAFIKALGNAEGHIEPTDVIEAARDPDSPIHDRFKWNVREAAQEHWLDTARSLIRFVRLEVEVERRTIIAPFYVNDPTRPPRSKRYVELTTASRDRDMAEKVLADECDRIVAALRRAQAVAAVLGLTAELERTLEDVCNLKSKAERAASDRAGRGRSRGRMTTRRTPRAKAA